MYTTRCVEFFIELYLYILRQYPQERKQYPLNSLELFRIYLRYMLQLIITYARTEHMHVQG